ncbi:hypothetical protein [Aeromonas veronii]|uniref:hypothetical protein n=1 Tax=Aeromonas veronii TaxID=654 RepID=UPI003BA3092E
MKYKKIAREPMRIESQEDYECALKLMAVYIEDYDNSKFLIESLSLSIDYWENMHDEFAMFNNAVAKLKNNLHGDSID